MSARDDLALYCSMLVKREGGRQHENLAEAVSILTPWRSEKFGAVNGAMREFLVRSAGEWGGR